MIKFIDLLNEGKGTPLKKDYTVGFEKDKDKFLKPLYNYIKETYDVELDPYPKDNVIYGSYNKVVNKKGKTKNIMFKVSWKLMHDEYNPGYVGWIALAFKQDSGVLVANYGEFDEEMRDNGVPKGSK